MRSFPTIVFKFESVDGTPDALYLFEPRNYFTNVDFRNYQSTTEDDDDSEGSTSCAIATNPQIWTFFQNS